MNFFRALHLEFLNALSEKDFFNSLLKEVAMPALHRLSIPVLAAFLVCLALFAASHAPAREAEEPGEKLFEALQKEAEAQEKIREWSQEKQDLLSRILHLKSELDWHKYRTQKHQEYISHSKQNIRQLEERIRDIKKLRRELEPYLDEVVQELASFRDSDLPFLKREREERMDLLRRVMSDYDLSLSDKLHRVLQALQVEAKYGSEIDSGTQTVSRDGEEMSVRTLRLGRIAKFYTCPEAERAGRLNPESGEWEAIPSRHAKAIDKAIRMSRQEHPSDLVELPVKGGEAK